MESLSGEKHKGWRCVLLLSHQKSDVRSSTSVGNGGHNVRCHYLETSYSRIALLAKKWARVAHSSLILQMDSWNIWQVVEKNRH